MMKDVAYKLGLDVLGRPPLGDALAWRVARAGADGQINIESVR